MQLENASADANFWESLQDMHMGTVEGNRGLIAGAERTIAKSEAEKAKASEAAAMLRNVSPASSAAKMSPGASASPQHSRILKRC